MHKAVFDLGNVSKSVEFHQERDCLKCEESSFLTSSIQVLPISFVYCRPLAAQFFPWTLTIINHAHLRLPKTSAIVHSSRFLHILSQVVTIVNLSTHLYLSKMLKDLLQTICTNQTSEHSNERSDHKINSRMLNPYTEKYYS